jgi:ER lumen protein retaining receptor
MKYKFRATYDPILDTFRIEFLLGGSLLLSLVFNYDFVPLEVIKHFFFLIFSFTYVL